MPHKKYKPLHFLRAHAKNNDSADVSTQVWCCEFEPDCNEGEYTNIVATCGGNSVCFIDVRSGIVQQKFNSEDLQEQFYCLAWGYPRDWGSILAVSGTKGRVYIFTPSQSSCLCSKVLARNKITINALLFHPKQTTLYCGCSNGEIVVCIIDPNNTDKPLEVVSTLKASEQDNQIHQLTYNLECSTLLAAGDKGLYAWTLANKSNEFQSKNGTHIKLPTPTSKPATNMSSKVVDTAVSLSGTLVATKTALEGHILVWDLAAALASKKKKNKAIVVTKGRFLEWNNTDNYYMGLGWDNKRKVLACGDDVGCTWLYDISQDLDNLSDLTAPVLQVSSIVGWPTNISDKELDKVRKLRLDVYDIVIAKVVLANNYLVAVTNNNMVCIWKLVYTENMYS